MMDAHGNQVLHVRGDSDTQLEELFDVLKPGPRQQTLGQQTLGPFRHRNLPKSFFEPPTRPSHSRESSQDSTNYNPLPQLPPSQGLPQVRSVTGQPVSHQGLSINHGRSQSSPAQLPLSLSAAPPQQQPQHNKQNSVDFVEEMGQLHIPSGPASWDALKSGQQRYFVNSQEQLSWPKSLSTNTLNANNTQGGHTPQGTLSPAQSHPSSPSVSIQNLGPLPRGWEQGVTPDGEIYYINHVDRTTSWFDPRLPKHLQRPGPMKVNQSSAGQTPQQPPPPALGPQLTQLPPAHPNTQPPQATLSPPQPPNQQVSPAPPPQITAAQVQQPPAAAAAQGNRQPVPVSSSSSNQNPQFIQYELERLKQEKDRLQREQEEIAKRELLLKEMMSLPKPQAVSEPQHSPAAPASIQAVSTSGVDPFLGQGSTNIIEAHARQNSGDSGLGGMGTSYSLPRTPEDFLSNVDEMDTQETPSMKQMLKPQGSDFNMNDLQNNACMDMGPLGDPDQSGMESEDLVPSLQEDITNLSTDLLNDVDVGKMENLLWL